MPGWAPRPTVKKESSRRGFDASHLPDLSSKHGNLTPLGSTRDRLSGDSEGFNKRVPLSMSVGAGLSSPQHADRAIIKPLKSSSSSSALLEHRTPGLEGLTAQPDDSNLASSLGARSVVEVDSFDDSFASSDPNIGGPALSPILHYANNPSSDSSGSDSDSSSDGFGSSSIDSLDEYVGRIRLMLALFVPLRYSPKIHLHCVLHWSGTKVGTPASVATKTMRCT